MRALWLPCVSLAAACHADGLVGSYQAQFDSAPKRARGILKAYFGQGPIRIEKDGTFAIYAIQQEGFWRVEGRRVIFVYSGFFGKPFPVPDDVLKASTPLSHMEGFVGVLDGAGGFTVKGLGSIDGPITFRRVPTRSTLELVRSGRGGDWASMEPFVALSEEASIRFLDLINIVSNSGLPVSDRNWAAWSLPKNMSAQQQSLTLERMDNLAQDKSLDTKQLRVLRSRLVRSLMQHPDDKTYSILVDGRYKDVVRPREVAKCIGDNKLFDELPRLLRLLKGDNHYAVEEAIESLVKLGASDTLAEIRNMTGHPDVNVQASAWTAILQLSDGKSERVRAVHEMARLFDKGEFINFRMIEALGECGLREAVPYLVNILENSADETDQIRAAEGLGRLGFQEAVPALLDAKNVETPDVGKVRDDKSALEALGRLLESAVEKSEVRKAAVEALWLFDKRRKSHARVQ